MCKGPSVIFRRECWTDQGLNPGGPAHKTGAYPIEIIGRRCRRKLAPFTVTSCLLLVFLFLPFSPYSLIGFTSSWCSYSSWIQPQPAAPFSEYALFMLINSSHGSSTDLITELRRPSLTREDPSE